jgi:hypothetical protein
MRHVKLAGLAAMALVALSGLGASTARADCSDSTLKLGNFDNRSAQGVCINNLGTLHLGLFINTTPGKSMGSGLECAKSTENEGNFSDSACTKEVEAGTGEFVEVAELKLSLPDISVVLGGTPKLHLQLENNKKTVTKLETTSGNVIEGVGLSLLLLTEKLSASGTFEETLFGAKEAGAACNSSGAAKEEVKFKGEYALVPISLKPLETGILFELEETVIECVKVKITVKGSVVAALNAKEGELTEVGAKFEGEKGKNKLTSYFNDEEKKVEAKLEANFGVGFLQSDQVVGEEVKLKALEEKMFEVTGR